MFRMCQNILKDQTHIVEIQSSESCPYLTTLLVWKIILSGKEKMHDLWDKALPVYVNSFNELQE